MNQFYAAATDALIARDGLVDKLVGDEIMGRFLSVFPSLGDRTCEVMVDTAREIMMRLDQATPSDRLPVGMGLTFGSAQVGNVGAGELKDFTAVGDVAAVYERVADKYPDAPLRSPVVKGQECGDSCVLAPRFVNGGQRQARPSAIVTPCPAGLSVSAARCVMATA